jgi:hypothetical protein
MIRSVKETTVRAFYYGDLRALRRHVADYLVAYDFAKQLKALKWRTPYETLQALYASRAELFHHSPDHFTPGPYTWALVVATARGGFGFHVRAERLTGPLPSPRCCPHRLILRPLQCRASHRVRGTGGPG